MKILKVKIEKHRTPEKCEYFYPEGWNAQKINVLIYADYPDSLGTVYEDCLCITDDETATELLRSSRVQEVGKNEANEFGRTWRPTRTMIDDEARVVEILQKLSENSAISALLEKHLPEEDLNSIDPDKPEPGLRRKPEFNIDTFLPRPNSG